MDSGSIGQLNPHHLIREGGDQLVRWLTETFSSWLECEHILAFGYVVIPQLGQRAGDAVKRTHLFQSCTGAATTGQTHDATSDDTAQRQVREILHRHLTYRTSESLPSQTESFTDATGPITYGVVRTPMQSGFDTPIGYLVIITKSAQPSQAVINAASRACAYVSVTIRSERALACLEDFSKSASEPREPPSLQDLVHQTKRVLGCKAVILWIYREHKDGGLLEKKCSDPPLGELTMYIGQGVAGRCAQTRTAFRFDDLQDRNELREKANAAPRHEQVVKANDWHSAIFMPVIYGSQLFGVLAAYAKRVAGFNDVDEQILAPYVDRIARKIGISHINTYLIAREQTEKIIPAMNYTIRILTRVHDARQELSRASSELSMLNLDEGSPTMREYYGKRKLNAEDAIRTARDLLKRELDAVKSIPSQDLNMKKGDFAAFVKGIVEEHRQTFREAHKITLSMKSFGGLLDANYDERITREVIVNVLQNAKDFLSTKKGERCVDLELKDETDFVVLRIEDNGPGIDAKDRGKVFEMFFTTKPDGYGIGLTVARMYMALQGGYIVCDRSRNYEVGTLFVLGFQKN